MRREVVDKILKNVETLCDENNRLLEQSDKGVDNSNRILKNSEAVFNLMKSIT